MSHLSKKLERLMAGILLRSAEQAKHLDLESLEKMKSAGKEAAEYTKEQIQHLPVFDKKTREKLEAFRKKYKKPLSEILQKDFLSLPVQKEIKASSSSVPADQNKFSGITEETVKQLLTLFEEKKKKTLSKEKEDTIQEIQEAAVQDEAGTEKSQEDHAAALADAEGMKLVQKEKKEIHTGSGISLFLHLAEAAIDSSAHLTEESAVSFDDMVFYELDPAHLYDQENSLVYKMKAGEEYQSFFMSAASASGVFVNGGVWEQFKDALPKDYKLPDVMNVFKPIETYNAFFTSRIETDCYVANPQIWGEISEKLPPDFLLPNQKMIDLFKAMNGNQYTDLFQNRRNEFISVDHHVWEMILANAPDSYKIPSDSALKVMEPMEDRYYNRLFSSNKESSGIVVNSSIWAKIKQNAPQEFTIPSRESLKALMPANGSAYQSIFLSSSHAKEVVVDPEVWSKISGALPEGYRLPLFAP